MIRVRVDVSTKVILYMNIKNHVLSKINIIDVHAKFPIEQQPIIGVNTLT
jgi:hypothetical protein